MWQTHHDSTVAAMYQSYGYVAEAHIAREPCSLTRSLPVRRLACPQASGNVKELHHHIRVVPYFP